MRPVEREERLVADNSVTLSQDFYHISQAGRQRRDVLLGMESDATLLDTGTYAIHRLGKCVKTLGTTFQLNPSLRLDASQWTWRQKTYEAYQAENDESLLTEWRSKFRQSKFHDIMSVERENRDYTAQGLASFDASFKSLLGAVTLPPPFTSHISANLAENGIEWDVRNTAFKEASYLVSQLKAVHEIKLSKAMANVTSTSGPLDLRDLWNLSLMSYKTRDLKNKTQKAATSAEESQGELYKLILMCASLSRCCPRTSGPTPNDST